MMQKIDSRKRYDENYKVIYVVCEVDAQIKLQKTIRDRTQQNSQMDATFELLEKKKTSKYEKNTPTWEKTGFAGKKKQD